MTASMVGGPGAERRPMGEQERLLHYLHGFGGLISVTILHVEGPVTAELVRRGLGFLQQRHALLRAHIRYRRIGFRSRLPYVVIEPELDTRGTTAIPLIETVGAWRELARRELRTPLRKGRNPRMRALLVRGAADGLTRIILTLDHAVADAQGTVMAVRDLMSFLADPTLKAEPAALPPPLESVYVKSDGGKRAYEPAIRLPHRRPRGTHRDTEFEWRWFTRAETDLIRAAARSQRTTMHGTLTAALLTAVHQRYGLSAMTAMSTVEFRRLGKPPLPSETFGCFIDVLRTRHELGGPFWPLAREVAFALVATIAKSQEQKSILKLPSYEVYGRELLPTIRSGFRLDGIGVTSAGETGLRRDYGPFVLDDVTMLVSMHVVGPGIFVAGLEREGALSIGLCYGAHTLAAAEVADLADRAAAILRQLPA